MTTDGMTDGSCLAAVWSLPRFSRRCSSASQSVLPSLSLSQDANDDGDDGGGDEKGKLYGMGGNLRGRQRHRRRAATPEPPWSPRPGSGSGGGSMVAGSSSRGGGGWAAAAAGSSTAAASAGPSVGRAARHLRRHGWPRRRTRGAPPRRHGERRVRQPPATSHASLMRNSAHMVDDEFPVCHLPRPAHRRLSAAALQLPAAGRHGG
jgi:hypothetical protein